MTRELLVPWAGQVCAVPRAIVACRGPRVTLAFRGPRVIREMSAFADLRVPLASQAPPELREVLDSVGRSVLWAGAV